MAWSLGCRSDTDRSGGGACATVDRAGSVGRRRVEGAVMVRYAVQGVGPGGRTGYEVTGSSAADAMSVAEEAFPGFRPMVAVPMVRLA
jgi:hypothetical protein